MLTKHYRNVGMPLQHPATKYHLVCTLVGKTHLLLYLLKRQQPQKRMSRETTFFLSRVTRSLVAGTVLFISENIRMQKTAPISAVQRPSRPSGQHIGGKRVAGKSCKPSQAKYVSPSQASQAERVNQPKHVNPSQASQPGQAQPCKPS